LVIGNQTLVRISTSDSPLTRRARCDRHGERKARTASNVAYHPQPSAEVLDDLPADVQPKSAAVGLVGQRVADLMELVEDLVVVLRADAAAVITDVDLQATALLDERDFDLAVRGVAELRRIREEVQHHLNHAVEIGSHGRNLLGQARRHLDVLLLEQLAHRAQRIGDHAKLSTAVRSFGPARLDLGEVEDLIDEARQTLGLLCDDAEEFLRCRARPRGRRKDLRERAYRGERVRNRASPSRRSRPWPVEPFAARRRVPRRSPPRARATSAQLVAVDDDQDASSRMSRTSSIVRCLLFTTEATMMRRGAADRAGELDLT
jgi:hypothetical protein